MTVQVTVAATDRRKPPSSAPLRLSARRRPYTAGQTACQASRRLRECPECIAYLKSYQATVKRGRDPDDPVPDEMPEELVDAILARRK